MTLSRASESSQTLEVRSSARWPDDGSTAVHQVFEAHARITPSAPAVHHEDRDVSYEELNATANRLCHRLLEMGVGNGGLVGVCVRRSAEALAAILAVLKSGAAFVPLDPDDPRARLMAVIQHGAPRVVLAGPEDRVRFANTETLWHDSVGQSADDSNPEAAIDVGRPACVYYTSGSSGRAKGVVLEHRSVLSRLAWADRSLLGERGLAMPLITRLTFAASLKELFTPWLRGASVWLPEDHVARDPARLVGWLSGQPRVALHCVPHLWEGMLDTIERGGASPPATLASLCFAGESPGQSLLNRSFALLPDLEVWNVYGSTETGTATAARLGPGETPHLGDPVVNAAARILDAGLRPVPAGETGELHIGGPGLACGYLGDPTLTAQRFVPDPTAGQPGARLFKTGDFVRRGDDGRLEFVARQERLVKIRGFRIEPDEVEAAIGQHPGVAQAVVTAIADERGGDRLVAHLVPAGGPCPDLAELRDFLISRLPAYMLPSRVVALEAVPRTPSGKVDRQAIRVHDRPVSPARAPARPPRTQLEEWMVALWKKVLGFDSVAVTDDFFELGGDSLAALRVVEQVAEKTGATLSPSVLLEAPTPASLSELVARSGAGASPLIAVRTSGARRPFFCVAPIPGALLPLRRLASHLDPGRPVYVLASHRLDDGPAPVEGMAARYVEAIRAVQPRGPYLLGGQCFGAVIALAAAHGLRAMGEKVSLLALFDAPPPPLRRPDGAGPGAGADRRRAIGWSRHRRIVEQPLRRALRNPRRSLRAFYLAVLEARRLGVAHPRTLLVLYRRQRRWALFEIPATEPHTGPVCHFLTSGFAARFEAGWRAIAGDGLETVSVASSHTGLLAEPAVREVADRLNRRLDAAEAGLREMAA